MVVGTLSRSTKTTKLSPHVIARYLKMIPKHWTRNGYACLKLEVKGCEKDQG